MTGRCLRSPGVAVAAVLLAASGTAGCATRKVDVQESGPTEPQVTVAPTWTGAPSTSQRTPTSPATGFTVTPPGGLSLVALADGTAEPIYSDDSFGGIHPMLVLVPDDWRGLDDHRWIEVMSIDGSGNEGGIYQELPAYLSAGKDLERVQIDGHPGVRLSSRTEGDRRVAGFVALNTTAAVGQGVDGGERRGLLVTGPDEDLDLFTTIGRRTRTTDDRTPVLDRVPDGWRVLGSLDSTQVMNNLDVWVDHLPAGRRGAMLGGPPDRRVTVQSLVGNEHVPLLKAIERSWHPYDAGRFGPVSSFSEDGVTGFAFACCSDTPPGIPKEWTLWFERDGVPFLATGLPDRDAAIAIATTVRPVTDDEWSAAQRTVGSTPPTIAPAPTFTVLPGSTVPATTSIIVPPGG